MSRFEHKVLVLDSRFEPVKIVTMEIAFGLIFTNRAQCLIDSERTIKSISKAWKIPWIVRLANSRPKNKKQSGPRLSRQNVYLRDSFMCQYCQTSPPVCELTLDHLIPYAQGGKTTWENVVTACRRCNMLKGSKTLEELGMSIANFPIKPILHPSVLFPIRYGLTSTNSPINWLPYLNFSIADRLVTSFSQIVCASDKQKMSFNSLF